MSFRESSLLFFEILEFGKSIIAILRCTGGVLLGIRQVFLQSFQFRGPLGKYTLVLS